MNNRITRLLRFCLLLFLRRDIDGERRRFLLSRENTHVSREAVSRVDCLLIVLVIRLLGFLPLLVLEQPGAIQRRFLIQRLPNHLLAFRLRQLSDQSAVE